MGVRCVKCGEIFSEHETICPKCGEINLLFETDKNLPNDDEPIKNNEIENKEVIQAENNNNAKSKIVTPTTIEELKQWYIEHHLPAEETTRFFIGKNYKGAKAFGIYKDESSSNVVVYKNKADGSRAVRYEGKDEAFAVNEIWAKLKEEIKNQKANNQRLVDEYRNGSSYNTRSRKNESMGIVGFATIAIYIISFIFMVGLCIWTLFQPERGYYYYDNEYYYCQDGTWYKYNSAGDWVIVTPPQELKKNEKKYYRDSYTSDGGYYYTINRFEDSTYYREPSTDSSDSSYSSDDYSWSSDDSWDSGSSDWDSDW